MKTNLKTSRNASKPKAGKPKSPAKRRPVGSRSGLPGQGELLEHISDGFVAFDAQMNYTYVNVRGGELLGREPKDLIGKNYWEEYAEAKGTPFANAYVRALETQQPILIEDYYAPFARWFENRIYPSKDGLSIFFTETTERKRAEVLERENEKSFRDFYDNISIGLYRTTPDGQILMCNPAMLRMLGYESFEEIAARNLETGRYEPSRKRNEFKEAIERQGGIRGQESEWIRKDGASLFVRENARLHRDSNGRVLYYEGTVEDITERKKVELAEREQRLLAESLRDTALILNSTLGFEELLDRILENIERVAPFRAANITIFKDGVTRIIRTRHHSIVDAHDQPPNDPIPLDDLPTFKEMADSLLPLVIPDTSADPHWSDIPGHGWIRSYIGVPIHKGETLIGFLNVNHDIPGFFTAQHAERLQAFAHHAAIALENARLFEQSQNEIAERKRAMEALRASEESLRKAQHVAHVGSWTWHIRENRLEWSDEMYLIFGIDKDTFNASLPDVIARAIHPDDREAVERANILVIQKNTPMPLEYRVVWEDETIHTVLAEAGELILDEAGNPSLLTGIVQDITARKQAELELQESEKQFSTVFFTNPVSQSILSQITGLVIEVNDTCCNLYGYSRAELLGADPGQLDLWANPADQLSILDELQRTGHVLPTEVMIRKNSGEIDTVLFTVEPISWKGIPCLLTSSIDITERKQAKEALLKSELEFRQLAEAMPQIVWITDPNGLNTYFNQQWVDYTGLSLEESYGTGWNKPFHPDDQQRAWDAWQNATKYGATYELDCRLRRADGVYTWWLIRGVPVLDAEGTVLKWFGTCTDINERKQAEEKIQRQVEYLSALRDIDSVIASTDNMQASLNRLISHTVRLLNVDAATVLLVNSERGTLEYTAGSGFWTEAVSTASVKLGESYAGRAAIEQRMVHIPNLTNEPDNLLLTGFLAGEKFTSYYGIPLIVNEKVIGVLEVFNRAAVARDAEWLDFFNTLAGQAAIAIDHARLIDDLQRSNAELEQRVAQRTEELEHANRAKDEFLAVMSHELRTPLNSIMGMSESLLEQRRDPLSESQQKYLQIIAASGSHLLELINDILDLSKIEAGQLDYYPQSIALDEVCRASLSFVKEQAMRKSITVTYQKETPVAKISADLRRLKQILVNLLTNAVKFTPDNGRIILQVRADAEADRIQFSVIDSGIGIALDDLKQIFVPFKQVDSRLTRDYEGTGLGLALVQKLTDLHGGSVSVESEVGKGSRFTINLPLGQNLLDQQVVPELDSELSSSEQAGKSNTPEPADRAVILLAEDNMANILTIGDYLESHGYPVFVAHDGFEAIELAELHEPDIILMDIQMPALDGLEAIRRLRADSRFASTPIIALTALAMPGDRERCMEAGATEYLSKPVRLKSLVKTIEMMLDSR